MINSECKINFNFDEAGIVFEVRAHNNHNVKNTPRAYLELLSPGINWRKNPEETWTDTDEVIFAVVPEIGKYTAMVCVDFKNKVVAFESELKLAWCLKEWDLDPAYLSICELEAA